ncbi:hypothetical protein H4S08_002588, partial [Coemansia sp. RSA 1365]
MTLVDKSANVSALDISDDELSQLLSQAKKDLTCLETEKKKKDNDRSNKNKGREHNIHLPSVPLRLDDGNMSEDSRLINIDSETGMARIDVNNIYRSNISQKSSITGEIEGKNSRPDPTIKRMTAGEASKEREKTA